MKKTILFSVFTLFSFLVTVQTSFSQITCVDSALSFNGNNQYVKLAPNEVSASNFLPLLNSDYTIECLIKWNGGVNFQRIFDFNYGTDFFMFLTPSGSPDNFPRFAISVTGLNQPKIVDATTALTPDVYHHIAVTFSKTNSVLNIFIDGANVGSGFINISADSIYHGSDLHDSSANFIGLSAFATDPLFNGDIDEFRISDSVRYTGNFSPAVPFTADDKTIALYHFDEGTGSIASDASGNDYNGELGSALNADDNDPTHVTCGTVLATTLFSFSATPVNNTVQLNWKTASETNTSYFDVEKSLNGINFSKSAQIKATGKSTGSSYSFTDVLPATGKNYYRLKQVDANGTYNYSQVITVTVSASGSFKIYPAITTGNLHISATQVSKLIIYNTTGIAVKTISLNSNEQNINVSNLPAGNYIIKNITTKTSLQFIKQ